MDISSFQSQSPLHRWSSLQRELFWIWDGAVMPESLIHTSDHSVGYWVWLLRRGEVRVRLENKNWHAKAGQWIVAPQGFAEQEFSKDARILSVHFHCQWPTGENLFVGQDAEIWNAKDFPDLENSATALNRLVHRHLPKVRVDLIERTIDYPVFIRFEQRFLEFLVDFYRAMVQSGRTPAQAGKCDVRLLKGIRCLHEAPLVDRFPVRQIQRETGLSRSHLDRLFCKEFGVTTREYWDNLRQKAAIHKLESTSLLIKEIGYHLGFKQCSHFTKWFCFRVGVSPSAYRGETPLTRAF